MGLDLRYPAGQSARLNDPQKQELKSQFDRAAKILHRSSRRVERPDAASRELALFVGEPTYTRFREALRSTS